MAQENHRGGEQKMSDICARRHRGNAESRDANKIAQRSKSECRGLLYAWFQAQGLAGGTCHEASVSTGIRYTTCSARISELKAEGFLVPTGERRKTPTGAGAAVLKAVKPEPKANQKSFGF
jgi:hypothetical protein